MAVLLILLGAVLPLLMTPALLFHYDVTPKTLLLCAILLAALCRAGSIPAELAELWSRKSGRLLVVLAFATVGWFAVSAAFSARVTLSIVGSGWREFGVATVAVLCLTTVLVAAHLCGRKDRIALLLRATTVAGLLVSVYGIAQYFNVDPFQAVQGYQAPDGDAIIVRPPGTFGHADYFGWWLAIDFFCALAARKSESRMWRILGTVSAAVVLSAAVLTGTRAALIAIIFGSLALIRLKDLRFRPHYAVGGGVAALLLAGFLFSTPGEKLRARIAWVQHEPTGGARPLLWRDSLRMAAVRPLAGFGPEMFSASFGQWESDELSRLYPDFHHESPHNVALDALTEAGAPGLVLVAAWALLGFRVARSANRSQSKFAPSLTAGILASGIAGLFSAAIMPPLLLTLLTLAALTALEEPDRALQSAGSRLGWLAFAAPVAAGVATFGCLLAISDYRLAAFQRHPGMAAYNSVLSLAVPVAAEDIYGSRMLASTCGTGVSGGRYDCWRTALRAAARATSTADDPANAWYNLAQFTAAQNDIGATRAALTNASRSAPQWFKPHWALAELSIRTGDRGIARAEAERAASLNSNHNPEFSASLATLQASLK
jgi:O-antigen ligase